MHTLHCKRCRHGGTLAAGQTKGFAYGGFQVNRYGRGRGLPQIMFRGPGQIGPRKTMVMSQEPASWQAFRFAYKARCLFTKAHRARHSARLASDAKNQSPLPGKNL